MDISISYNVKNTSKHTKLSTNSLGRDLISVQELVRAFMHEFFASACEPILSYSPMTSIKHLFMPQRVRVYMKGSVFELNYYKTGGKLVNIFDVVFSCQG